MAFPATADLVLADACLALVDSIARVDEADWTIEHLRETRSVALELLNDATVIIRRLERQNANLRLLLDQCRKASGA